MCYFRKHFSRSQIQNIIFFLTSFRNFSSNVLEEAIFLHVEVSKQTINKKFSIKSVFLKNFSKTLISVASNFAKKIFLWSVSQSRSAMKEVYEISSNTLPAKSRLVRFVTVRQIIKQQQRVNSLFILSSVFFYVEGCIQYQDQPVFCS